MHIAMFCSNYPPHTGGLEVMARRVAVGLARRHEVTVIASAWEDATGASEEEGARIFRLPTLHATERWGVPYPIPIGPGVREALAAVASVDVIHAHGALYPCTVMAMRMARRHRTPAVLTEHVGFVRYRNPLLNGLETSAWATIGNWVVKSSRAVAVYNGRVAEWLKARYPGLHTTYIGNGVDLEQFRPRDQLERKDARSALGLPQDGKLVLFVGRDAAKKNLDTVLAVPRDGFTLVTCGARRAQLPPDVIDLGIVPHERMWQVYASADLMVLPSTGEGFPLAMQEALAAGVPLLLLWDLGYGEWLTNDVVASCGSLEELSQRLPLLAQDVGEQARLRHAAREWAAAHWSWDATVAEYEALYLQAGAVKGTDTSVTELRRASIA
jgi:glycosyltransferase involved in cell wall biosynthesis